MKLRDISKYQNDIDYDAIDGIDALIIRAGYRGYGNGVIYKDIKLDKNIAEAKEHNIPFALYFYSQAVDTTEAQIETQWLLRERNKHDNVLFLALDMELTGSGSGRADYLTPEKRQLIANTFSKTVKDAGYQPFIYSNEAYWQTNLDYNSSKYMNWVRNWSREPTIPYEIWQYTNKGHIPGIKNDVDLNISNLTIDDITGKDTTYRIFKNIEEKIKNLSDLITDLRESMK